MYTPRTPFADVDRVFDELTRGLTGSQAGGFGALDATVDAETGVLTAFVDLPGADRDSLSVRVVGDTLVVEATRPRSDVGGRVVAAERPTGRTRRVLRTRRALDPDSVTASFDAGVLVVRAETRTPGRTVNVSFAAEQQLSTGQATTESHTTTGDQATGDHAGTAGEATAPPTAPGGATA